jgi:hypothetical protein
MAKNKDTTKSQHHAQQAYQKGFFEYGKTKFLIFDNSLLALPSGKIKIRRSRNVATSQCFERDFFYTSNYYKEKDYLEKKFFEPIDASGAKALKYMLSNDKYILPDGDVGMNLLKYISAQKFRTPKGLELIKESFSEDISRENLMEILQQVHENMTITLAESIIEILDASKCETKFIVSDAPVVEWNRYTSQPDIDKYLLKGTQVIFPISKNFCLISTPRELANKKLAKKDFLKARINARKYGSTIFDIRKLQNLRDINNDEVFAINKLIKDHALRYIAGGKQDYLFPPNNLPDVGSIIAPKEFKRSGGIAQEVNGKVVGVDEYGRPLQGKNLEDFTRFFDWVKNKKK